MSRKSVLDLYPTVSTEAMVPAPETVAPLVFESEPEVLDETTELEGQIQETLAPTSNFTSELVAAEQYLQVLTKFNQLDTQVSQEVYDTVRTTLGLEASDQPLSQRVINFIKELYRKAVEAIGRAAAFIKRLFFSYARELKAIHNETEKLHQAFKALPFRIAADTEPVLSIKSTEITAFTSPEQSPKMLSESLNSAGRFIVEILSLTEASDKSVTVPGNRTLQIIQHISPLSRVNPVLTAEEFSLTINSNIPNDTCELSINFVSKFFSNRYYIEMLAENIPEALEGFEKLCSDSMKEIETLNEIFSDSNNLQAIGADTAYKLSNLVRIRDRMKYVPELLKYFITILKNDIKIGEQILQIAKSK